MLATMSTSRRARRGRIPALIVDAGTGPAALCCHEAFARAPSTRSGRGGHAKSHAAACLATRSSRELRTAAQQCVLSLVPPHGWATRCSRDLHKRASASIRRACPVRQGKLVRGAPIMSPRSVTRAVKLYLQHMLALCEHSDAWVTWHHRKKPSEDFAQSVLSHAVRTYAHICDALLTFYSGALRSWWRFGGSTG